MEQAFSLIVATVIGSSLLLTFISILYRIIRPHYPVAVNCWFCGTDSKVPFGNRNCWDCPQCEQYNGFSMDGDYNKPIPSQHYEDLNHSVVADQEKQGEFNSESAVLCRTCANNQQLKIKQLADFVPFDEHNFDTEVELFRQHLEHVYRLCTQCERDASRIIAQQNSLLYGKIQQSVPCRPVPEYIEQNQNAMVFYDSPTATINLSRFLVVLCALVVLLVTMKPLLHSYVLRHSASEFWLSVYSVYLYTVAAFEPTVMGVTVLGMITHIVVVYVTGKHRLLFSDSILCFCWLLQVFNFTALINVFVLYANVTIATVALVTALWSWLARRQNNSKTPIRMKKRRYYGNNSLADISSLSAVSDSSTTRSFQWPQQTYSAEHVEAEVPQVAQTQPPSAPSAPTTPQITRPISPTPNRFNLTENLDNNFETMSIGSCRSTRSNGVFDSTRWANGAPSDRPATLESLRVNKPLISPARFNVKKNNQSERRVPQADQSQSSMLHTSHSESSDRPRNGLRNRNGFVNNPNYSSVTPVDSSTVKDTHSLDNFSDSERSSFCPVDSTLNLHNTHGVPWIPRHLMFWCVLVGSVALNLALAAVAFGYSINPTTYLTHLMSGEHTGTPEVL